MLVYDNVDMGPCTVHGSCSNGAGVYLYCFTLLHDVELTPTFAHIHNACVTSTFAKMFSSSSYQSIPNELTS